MFLLRLYTQVATKIRETDTGSDFGKFAFWTMLAAYIFQEVISRNDGFGQFEVVGSCHSKSQDYFLDLIWDIIKAR